MTTGAQSVRSRRGALRLERFHLAPRTHVYTLADQPATIPVFGARVISSEPLSLAVPVSGAVGGEGAAP